MASNLVLVNPSATDAATLKVVWTSQLYGVPLQGPTKAAQSVLAHNDSSSKKPTLVDTVHKVVVTGGGNAMATAVAHCGNQSGSAMALVLCDEWCEWERTVLRPALAKPKKLTAALQYLEECCQNSGSGHLVESHDSLADVVVVSTLVRAAVDTTALPAVHRLVTRHQTALQGVQPVIDKFIEQAATASSSYQVNWDEPSLYKILTDIFQTAVNDLVAQVTAGGDLASIGMESWAPNLVSKCNNPKIGDYQCSAAMPVFAALRKSGQALPPDLVKPQDVAHKIVAIIMTNGKDNHPVVTELSVSGPGFVLCRLQPKFLEHHVNALLRRGALPVPQGVPPQTCLVDFSSPNIAKEMHVGHLRSTIIGETVCRVLEYVGHKVHRVNHVGDWGTQFGMLIQYLREEYPDVVGQDTGELPNITDLTVFYKNAKLRFDESPEFKKASQLNVVQLQAGDPECRKIWQMLCDVSRREFEKVYKRLDVTLTEFGESFYNSRIPPVIDELMEKKIVEIEEGGAKIAWLEGFPSPLMLQKTDGGYGYDSTDVSVLERG